MAVCPCCRQEVRRAGLVALDAEFRSATTARGSIWLSQGEMFQLLALLADGAPRPKYQDFLIDALRLPNRNRLHRMIVNMRRRIAPLGLIIETVDGAYRLLAGASTHSLRRVTLFTGGPQAPTPALDPGQLDLVEFLAKGKAA